MKNLKCLKQVSYIPDEEKPTVLVNNAVSYTSKTVFRYHLTVLTPEYYNTQSAVNNKVNHPVHFTFT